MRKKYGIEGLHVVYFIQNGLFLKYIDILAGEFGYNTQMIKKKIDDILSHIEERVIFIRSEDKNILEKKVKEIVSKIRSHTPEVFVISSIGGAMDACEMVRNKVMEEMKNDYECEFYGNPQRRRNIYFLIRKDTI